MINLSVGVNGRAGLQQQLDKLKRKASKAQLDKALLAGGKVFQQAIQERTPERADTKSGDALAPGELRDDVQVNLSEDGVGKSQVLVGPGPDTAAVMLDLEFGHDEVRNGRKVGHVPAYPVMRPAYEASRNASMQAVIESLQEQEGD